ncbi:CehA/McbA family metallohydrolase [Paenibacillus kandeliae]|uniref:CehA/McbA family metallohydrolase n=1 Tax=Paenibacillus kandeliae TaxID=3231269 RepID=UPI003457BA93
MTLRWIPAELHTHTFHSDGSQSLEELAQSAKQAGIDVIALTDHNTQSGFMDRNRVETSTGVRVIAGMEWTTFYGHMVTLGLQQYVDWRAVGQRDIEKGIAQVHQAGGIAGIVHPFRIGSPICTGCYWEYPVHDWSQIDYIEVWSTLMPFVKQDSQRAFALWTSLLNEGHRLAATSGRDWHRTLPEDAPAAITYIGLEPAVEVQDIHMAEYTNIVGNQNGADMQNGAYQHNGAYEQNGSHEQTEMNPSHLSNDRNKIHDWHVAAQRTFAQLQDDRQYIDAIRSGRLSVTMGPMLDLYAVVPRQDTDRQQSLSAVKNLDSDVSVGSSLSSLPEISSDEQRIYRMGDTIDCPNERLDLYMQLDRSTRRSHYELTAQQLRVVVMSDKGILAETKLDSEQLWQEWNVEVNKPMRWLRAELYGYFGGVSGMLAFTNAIYID